MDDDRCYGKALNLDRGENRFEMDREQDIGPAILQDIGPAPLHSSATHRQKHNY
jgi:hypothetical protein